MLDIEFGALLRVEGGGEKLRTLEGPEFPEEIAFCCMHYFANLIKAEECPDER